jgi:hypothetical protein
VIKKISCCLVIVVALGIGTVISQEEKGGFTADRHKGRGMSCIGCHKEEQPKTAAPAKSCIACHKSLQAVAERTKDFTPNPHENHIISSSDVECTQCHQGHKADTIMCHSCHAGMEFTKQPAETK